MVGEPAEMRVRGDGSPPLELRINMGNMKRILIILDARNHEKDISDNQRNPIMKGISTTEHLRW
jgi:hypothetical protein